MMIFAGGVYVAKIPLGCQCGICGHRHTIMHAADCKPFA